MGRVAAVHGEGTIVYDGAAELDQITVEAVDQPCPSCGASCRFDPVAVASDGTAIGWATSPEIAALQECVVGAVPLLVGEFDGRRTLRSRIDRGCVPSVGSLECTGCSAELLAVVSYGEVQPARWWLVVEGVVGRPTGDRPEAHGR